MSLSLLLALLGCQTPTDSAKDDADGDGWSVEDGDCDDDNASVYPVANEVWYDDLDQNCDGNDDDQDGDGVSLPSGDCDDTDARVYPGATEVCDDLDNDCNGEVDDGATDLSTGYADVDGDGYGDPAAPVEICGEPDAGVVEDATDCDDADPTVHPNTDELCDDIDNDCDGYINEGEGAPPAWYRDGDGDGHGDPVLATASCEAPEGYVAAGDDCDDDNPGINPDIPEDCAAGDLNCDGDDTAGAYDALDYYLDADSDGYGDVDSLLASCTDPGGRITTGGDCDDADAGVNPGEVEVCNGVDDDCEGTVDEGAVGATTWYTDNDGDGYGTTSVGASCDAPAGTAALDGDCDDSVASTYPGAEEACDGVDGNCDGAVDDPLASGTTYTDADGDGYGDASTAADWTCVAPSDGVDNGDDCDDTDGAVSPGSAELCNSIDDDCDGSTDENGAADGITYYIDSDKDGYGKSSSSVVACAQPSGYVTGSTDCDDADKAINPAATESCDSEDNDCDGKTDESGAVGEVSWYPDDDGDGFGDDGAAVVACTGASGSIEDGGDCDDTDPDIHPGATEVCDHVDNNCTDGTADESGAGWTDNAGNFTDVTSIMSSGKSTDPVFVGDSSTYDLQVDEGTVHLCAGTWYAKFAGSTAGTEFSVLGSGADLTTITSGGSVSGTIGSIVVASSCTINLTDLTVTGGLGSSSGKGGAIVAGQSTGTPTIPNIRLTGVSIEGNGTTYGGGITINSYAWVDLIDSVVMDNAATSQGGAVYVSDAGQVTCTASAVGAAGFMANSAPTGGGIYFASTTNGTLSSTGCDWGADSAGDDNATYDIAVGSAHTYCYGNASSTSTKVSCGGGTCTASTETCP